MPGLRNTGRDNKGKIVRDEGTDHPFTFTYYGGGDEKSLQYRERHLTNYDRETGTCKIDGTQTLSQTKKMEDWNTYQKNTWYQEHMNHVQREECPPGLRAEFRQKGVVEKEVNLRETGVAVFDAYSQGQGYLGRTRDHTSSPDVFVDTYALDQNDYNDDHNFTNSGTFTFRPRSTPSGEFQHLTGAHKQVRPSTAPAGGNQETRQPRPLSQSAFTASQNRMRRKSAQDRAIEAINRTTYQPPAPVSYNTTSLPSASPNPKTMFVPQSKPLFGPPKGHVKSRHGSTSSRTSTGQCSSTRPASALPSMASTHHKSVRFTDTNVDNGEGVPTARAGLDMDASGGADNGHNHSATNGVQTTSHQHDRSMSGTAITRRHMGVTVAGTPTRSASDPHTSPTQKLSLTARLTAIAKSGNLRTTTALQQLHPTSGYERGLKGTLYADFWRSEELMRADGKICFHPLSYDVLETLTYGPPDATNNILQNDVFPPMPPNRRKLVNKIFDALCSRSSSGLVATVRDVVAHYDAANHPAVIGHRVSPEEILEGIIYDLLGEEVSNTVSTYQDALDEEIHWDKFEHHYAAVSSATHCDAYFELLLYSTWRGLEEVWAGCSSIRRMVRRQESDVRPGSLRGSNYVKVGTTYISRLGSVPFDKVMAADVTKNYQREAQKEAHLRKK